MLIYAVNRDCDEHAAARGALEGWLGGNVPFALTWGVIYEFLRVVTHPKVFGRPLAVTEALTFLDPLLGSELVTVLSPTPRHPEMMRRVIQEFGSAAGNIFNDLRTAVLMREHGVSEIMTADTDFRKFGFLTVTDPVH